MTSCVIRAGDNSCGFKKRTSSAGKARRGDELKGWFSPARPNDLARLSPTDIAIGSLDLFVDEILDFARQLIASGVAVGMDL
jgi:acetyl esterase/lipase